MLFNHCLAILQITMVQFSLTLTFYPHSMVLKGKEIASFFTTHTPVTWAGWELYCLWFPLKQWF